MALESPLFQSSLELLGHAISHFNQSKELDRKLVILHLANSIELILKDLVLDHNESIYKNPKETITVHTCIEILKLKNISIPCLNKIELLIDERNALQHRFGSPNELTTIFYVNIVISFFKEILNTYYSQDYEEIIKQFIDEKDLIAFQAREPRNDSELENLKNLAKLHPLGALLSANAYLERVSIDFYRSIGMYRELFRYSLGHPLAYRVLERIGVMFPEELKRQMHQARSWRNLATHGKSEPTLQEVSSTIKFIEELEKFFGGLDIENIQRYAKEYISNKERDQERLNARLEADKEKLVSLFSREPSEGSLIPINNSSPTAVAE